jgi:hypothetical protein
MGKEMSIREQGNKDYGTGETRALEERGEIRREKSRKIKVGEERIKQCGIYKERENG